MAEQRERNYLKGAAILSGSIIASKIIGALFKIPLFNIIGKAGSSTFHQTYQIFTLLLTISYAGIPVALSRLISISLEKGNTRQAKKYFKVALPAFAFIGAVASICMFVFAPHFARFIENPLTEMGIRVLSPAVFLCCVISVYEGWAQGHGDMVPTAIKQLVEVISKLVIGMGVAWVLVRRGATTENASAGAITGVVIGLVLALPILMYYKKRKFRHTALSGDAMRSKDTLVSVIKVSIPIALGASFMNILSIIDSKVVMMRLMDGIGLSSDAALAQFGLYSNSAPLFNLLPALISSITVSVIPVISAFTGTNRHGDARATTESAIKMMSLIAMPAAIGMAVLAKPIYGALYDSQEGAQLLMILGIASFFACAQLMTTAILQANGRERVPIVSFVIGGIVQIVCDWILVGTPAIGIIGSPIGTLACYVTITLINLAVIIAKVPSPPRILRSAGKPAIAAAVMGVAAASIYGLSQHFLAGRLGTGRYADIVYTGIAVVVAVIVYFAIVIASHTLTREDMKLLPKGDKLAKLLRVRN